MTKTELIHSLELMPDIDVFVLDEHAHRYVPAEVELKSAGRFIGIVIRPSGSGTNESVL